MLVGHIAVGLTAKRLQPTLSLGTLVLAAMLADLLWCFFLMVGLECVQFKPGRGAANYFVATNIALSHSLLMDAVWGALIAIAYYFRGRDARAAWIIFFADLSHWFLDFLSHQPDMPLAPGMPLKLGLGLWNSVPLAILVEGSFWLLAVVLFAIGKRPRKRTRVYWYWIVVALLTLVWYNNLTGPPPPDTRLAPVESFVLFSLTVVWAYWMNSLHPAENSIP